MKAFKNVKWDADAENNTFQELFKKKRKSQSERHRDIKKKLKSTDMKVNKKISYFINKNNVQPDDTVNLISTPLAGGNTSKSKKKKLKKQTLSNKIDTNFAKEDLHSSKHVNYNSEKTMRNKRKQQKKLQRNISDQINTDLKSEDAASFFKTPINSEKLPKCKKKKLKKLQADTSNINVQSNDSVNHMGKDKLSKIEKKKLKKMQKRFLDKKSTTNEKVIADSEILTNSKKRRLRKLQNKLKNKMNSTSESKQISNINNNSGTKLKNKERKQLLITEDGSALQENKKAKKHNQKKLNHTNVSPEGTENLGVKDKKKRKQLKNKLKSTNSIDKIGILKNIPNGAIKLKTDIETYVSKVKRHKNVNDRSLNQNLVENETSGYKNMKKKEKFFGKLKDALEVAKEKIPVLSLRQKMMEKLKSARFRFINEQIYTTDSKEAQKIFQDDPDAFKAYHDGYRKQVKQWPLNPLDAIISSIKKMSKTHIVADFGCGDAKLAKSVNQKVYSFDLVAADDSVIACDMSKVPLENNTIDVAVFCLSLMGTNLRDYLFEVNRVLKIGGILKIAEVESRFENVEDFIKGVSRFGFKNIWKDQSHNLFYFLDFKKERDVKHKNKLPTMSLLPCLYKKR